MFAACLMHQCGVKKRTPKHEYKSVIDTFEPNKDTALRINQGGACQANLSLWAAAGTPRRTGAPPKRSNSRRSGRSGQLIHDTMAKHESLYDDIYLQGCHLPYRGRHPSQAPVPVYYPYIRETTSLPPCRFLGWQGSARAGRVRRRGTSGETRRRDIG